MISHLQTCSGVLSGLNEVCDLIDKTGAGCKQVVNVCNRSTLELFSGTLIESATPKNMKVWNGLGGLGGFYNSAAVCLMRDLLDLPGKKITTHAELSLLEAASRQEVAISAFDPKTGNFQGYHRLKACGPVVGCLDVFTQKFHLFPVSNKKDVSGLKAGMYEIKESYALDFESDGIAQGLTTVFPKIDVPTPIGLVTVQPEFKMGRAAGMILSPFQGVQKTNYPSMYLPTKENRTFDTYGIITGAKQSTISPIDTELNDPDWKYTQKGWISTAALGGRNAGPKSSVWTPKANDPFPARPDLDLTQSRSEIENTPNAYMGASANVEYPITDKLPAALKKRINCSGYPVALCLNEVRVFAKPSIDLVFSSQLSFFQNEQSYWNGSKGGSEYPLPKVTPDTFDQHKELRIIANSAVSAMTRLETGLDLVIHIDIKTPFGFEKDIVNLHPRITIPLVSESALSKDTKIAKARSLGSAVLSQKRFFQDYTSWNGKNLASNGKDGGTEALVSCFKTPEVPYEEPPAPQYQPGDPQDLLDLLEQPCNICVAWDDIHYKDQKGIEQVEPKGVFTVFPVSHGYGVKPENQWACLQAAQLGCYDTCTVAQDGKLTLKHTAVQLLEMGKGTDMPKSCKVHLPTVGS